jgi:CheY-like chemotaxis protein
LSLPLLLLADDSEAVLAFGRAALAGHYQIACAADGAEAWDKVQELRPAGVVLDLSMPVLDGDVVLARMQKSPRLRHVPVLILSSEKQRAAACLLAGAKAFLAKPVRAPDLLSAVNRVLDQALREERAGLLPVLFVRVHEVELGLLLESVVAVVPQVATRPLPLGPVWLRELIDVHGEPVCVLDLCARLDLPHQARLEDRQLVIVQHAGQRLALCVDGVREPEELPRESVVPQAALGGAAAGELQRALVALVKTARGPVTVIDPHALISDAALAALTPSRQGGQP